MGDYRDHDDPVLVVHRVDDSVVSLANAIGFAT